MGILGSIVVYFMIWWTVLFAVLPWGVRRNDGAVAGADAGAPEQPNLGRKFIITSVISAVIWLVVYALVSSGIISFRELAERMSL